MLQSWKISKEAKVVLWNSELSQRMELGLAVWQRLGLFYKHNTINFTAVEHFPAACQEQNKLNYLPAGSNVGFLSGKSPEFLYFSRYIATGLASLPVT